MFTGRMYFGREILRHDFEPMYVKAGSNNVAERIAAIQVNIPGQRVYEDLADYGRDNPAAYPHVIIEGLEADPAKLHKKPGMLAKGASGIIVQHQKATRGATIGGLTQWREGFTPEMLTEEERLLVGMRAITDPNVDPEEMFKIGEAWFDEDGNAWTMPKPFVILDASSIGLEIPITFEDKLALVKTFDYWTSVLGHVMDLEEMETSDDPDVQKRFKAMVLHTYKSNVV